MATVWAVGDSLTWGVSWPADTPGGWRAVVADEFPSLTWLGSLSDNPAPGGRELRHDGHPGWRTDEVMLLVAGAADCDLAIVQAGTNDVIQRWAPGRTWHQTYDEFDTSQREAFAAGVLDRFDTLLAAVCGRAARVITWTLPPVGPGGACYGSPSVTDVNAGIPDVAAAHGAVVADVHLALAPDGTVTPGLLGPDGVHPTTAGYAVIASVLRPLVQRVLAMP